MAEPSRFLVFTRRLETLGARYMVTGSVAAIAYSAPRFTYDIDIVVVLDRTHIARLPEVFPEAEFYLPPTEVIAAETRERRGHFNIIHHETGFKADIYPAGGDPLHAWASRARKKARHRWSGAGLAGGVEESARRERVIGALYAANR
jgi:hypothetical protein